MNNAKLCAIVVLMAIIGPIMVGYVWPVSAEDQTIYNITNSKDVTTDFGSVPVGRYSDYYDLYANNYNVYSSRSNSEYLWDWATYPEDYTQVVSSMPYLSYAGTFVSVTADQYGFVDFNLTGLRNFFDSHKPVSGNLGTTYAMAFETNLDANDPYRISIDDVGVSSIFYYYDSNILTYLTWDNTELKTATSWSSIKIGFTGPGTYSFNPSWAVTYGGMTYMDVDKGISPSFGDTHVPRWFNGYTNKVIDVLIKPVMGEGLYFDFASYNTAVQTDSEVHVWCSSSGTIYLSASTPLDFGTEILGSINDYGYVLLSIDADSSTVSLSGIPTLRGFSEDYTKLIRKTVTVELFSDNHPATFMPIKWMDIHGNSGGGYTTYLVTHTLSNVINSYGIDNGEVDFRSRTSGDFQIQIKNPYVWPIGNDLYSWPFQIKGNNQSYNGSLDREGNIRITGNLETITVPFKDMIISSIERTIYVNGTPVIEFPTYQSKLSIAFNAEYVATVIYSELEQSTKTEYGWMAGGFGLDESGFCIVGLIISVLSGLTASLYGRRSGSKMFFVTFVSGIISAVYLIILMGGL